MQVTGSIGLHDPHNMTSVDEGVFMHIQGCEGLPCQLGYPVTQIDMIGGNDAYLLVAKCVGDGELRPTAVTDFR